MPLLKVRENRFFFFFFLMDNELRLKAFNERGTLSACSRTIYLIIST